MERARARGYKQEELVLPIQKSITQPTGDVATYHKVSGGSFTLNTKDLSVNVSSYLDGAHTDTQGFTPLSSATIDIAFIMPTASFAVPANTTVAQVVQAIVEGALVAQPGGLLFNGAQVA